MLLHYTIFERQKTFFKKFSEYFLYTAIFLASLFVDKDVNSLIKEIQYFPIHKIMIWITTIGIIIVISLISLILLLRKKYILLTLCYLSAGLFILIGDLLKNILLISRPPHFLYTVPLALGGGFSFPSIHTGIIFSFIFIARQFFKGFNLFFLYLTAILLAFSRLYLGVHWLSDISAAIVLSAIISIAILYLEERFKIVEQFSHHIKNKFELRRQIMHALCGLSIVFLYYMGFLSIVMLAGILTIGGVISLVSRSYQIPIIKTLLVYFERDLPRKHFPGMGSFFLVLGSFLSLIVFPKNTALAAITIMAVGDALSTIVGTYFGRIKNPLNPTRHIEGLFTAIAASSFASHYFIPWQTALLASFIAMLFESLELKIEKWKIDDNLTVPLIAGGVISLVKTF